MTKTAKHFANNPEITESIIVDEYNPVANETYYDAGRITRQATHRGMSRAAVFAISGVITSVLLAGAIFLSSPVRRTTAAAETPTITQKVDATKKTDDAKAKAEAEAKKTEAAKTEADIAKAEEAKKDAEARIQKAEEAKKEAEARAKKAEEERAKAEAEAKAAEEQNESTQKAAEPHTNGESVTIALPTADADVYAEWQKDSNGNWWACFSTYNGTAVQAIPAQDGGWLFYAVTDSGLVQIQRVNESTIEDATGPAGTSSHWTDTATNTVWY